MKYLNKIRFLTVYFFAISALSFAGDGKLMQETAELSGKFPKASRAEIKSKKQALIKEDSAKKIEAFEKAMLTHDKLNRAQGKQKPPVVKDAASPSPGVAAKKGEKGKATPEKSKAPTISTSTQKRSHSTGGEGAEAGGAASISFKNAGGSESNANPPSQEKGDSGGAEAINFGSSKKANDSDDGLNH